MSARAARSAAAPAAHDARAPSRCARMCDSVSCHAPAPDCDCWCMMPAMGEETAPGHPAFPHACARAAVAQADRTVARAAIAPMDIVPMEQGT
ncbi:hypothetical protein NJLHNGOC_08790 [Novacetimonas cocois]|uniref:Uncharacterized protein n=1 Tax=Novacetimonas cocois TaxID=1747507 RepID=A0A365YX15_9PROT|nr:hypothetical protein NJLHNGOC_08790 [Novacetimonas cocois]